MDVEHIKITSWIMSEWSGRAENFSELVCGLERITAAREEGQARRHHGNARALRPLYIGFLAF